MLLNIIAAIFIGFGILRVSLRLAKQVTVADILYLLFWLALIASFFIDTKLFLIVPLLFLVASQVTKKKEQDGTEEDTFKDGEGRKPFQLSEPPKPQPIGRSDSGSVAVPEPEPSSKKEEDDTESHEDFILEIPKIAEDCVRMTKEMLNEDLDFSPESLETVDRLITETWNGEYALPIDGLAIQFGSYTGEVIRRHLGGEWAFRDGNYVLLDVQSVKTAFVFSKAYRRLKNGEEDSLAFFYRAMKSTIDDAKKKKDEDSGS